MFQRKSVQSGVLLYCSSLAVARPAALTPSPSRPQTMRRELSVRARKFGSQHAQIMRLVLTQGRVNFSCYSNIKIAKRALRRYFLHDLSPFFAVFKPRRMPTFNTPRLIFAETAANDDLHPVRHSPIPWVL